jgi:hypothetical protein
MLKTSGFPGGPALHHLSELPEAERLRLHGRGHIMPMDPVEAGERVAITFRFDIGQTSIPTGGKLRVVWKWPFDWGELQTADPDGEAYLGVSASRPGVRLQASYGFRNDLIPWNHGIQMEMVEGCLEEGDQVEFICGGAAADAGRWRAPTLIAAEADFLFLINPEGADQWLQLSPVRSFPIVAGSPARMVVLGPSEGRPDEELQVIVRIEDAWGNPLRVPNLEPQLTLVATDDDLTIAPRVVRGQPAYQYAVRFHEPGTRVLAATLPGTDLNTVSNPIRIDSHRSKHRVFWGDLHAGQGEIGCGIGSIGHHFDFARHVAGLQFATYQANDHHVTRDMWRTVCEQSAAAHENGAFVVYPGCEWSAETPLGGDRNVAYLEDEPRLRRSGRFFTEDGADPETDLTTAEELLEALKDEPILINLHAGGRPTNFEFHEPQVERLVEIHSTHGTAEWFFFDALRRGYRVGVTAGADGVSGRPGADHPGSRQIRNVRSGITAVYATDLTREGIWEGLRARRTYATTGERMMLSVIIDGQPMGSEFNAAAAPLIELSVEGTQAIEQIDLLCGTEILKSWTPARSVADEGSLRLLWGGTERCGSAPAQRVVWDGTLALEEGKVRGIEPVGFCSPNDTIEPVGDSGLRWRSVTAGNRAGVHLDLEGDESTLCRFSTGPCQFEFRLSQVMCAPMVVAGGGVSRHVTVSRPPDANGPRRVELNYRDTRDAVGTCPYWVRVTQVDQNQAWSSPIYVTRV